jgi:hypothetical protein
VTLLDQRRASPPSIFASSASLRSGHFGWRFLSSDSSTVCLDSDRVLHQLVAEEGEEEVIGSVHARAALREMGLQLGVAWFGVLAPTEDLAVLVVDRGDGSEVLGSVELEEPVLVPGVEAEQEGAADESGVDARALGDPWTSLLMYSIIPIWTVAGRAGMLLARLGRRWPACSVLLPTWHALLRALRVATSASPLSRSASYLASSGAPRL